MTGRGRRTAGTAHVAAGWWLQYAAVLGAATWLTQLLFALGPAPLRSMNLGAAVSACAAVAVPARRLTPIAVITPLVAVAVLLATGHDLGVTSSVALGQVVQLLVMAALAGQSVDPAAPLAHRDSTVRFLTAAGLSAAAGSLASVPVVMLLTSGGPSFSAVFWGRTAAQAIGIVTITPVLLLTWATLRRRRGGSGPGAVGREQAHPAWLALWAVLLAATFVATVADRTAAVALPFAPLALLIFASLHLGRPAATTLSPGLVVATALASGHGAGRLAETGPGSLGTLFDTQLYCLTAACSAWVLAAVMEERAASVARLRASAAELERAQQDLERRVAERTAALNQLEELTSVVAEATDTDALLDELIHRVARLLHADTVRILLLDEERKLLFGGAALGLEEEVEQRVGVPVGRGYAGTIAADGRPWVVDDLRTIEVFSPVLRNAGVLAMAGVPLLTPDGRVLGVMHVGSRRAAAFTAPNPDPVPLLERIAERVSAAVVRQRLQAEVRTAQERFRQAMDGLLDPVMILRAESRAGAVTPVYVNAVAAEQVAVGAEAAQTNLDLTTLRRQAYQRVLDTGEPFVADGMCLQQPVDGRAGIWADLRAYRLGRDELVLSWRDVTERVVVARDLAASEERFRAAFEDGPVGMAMASLEPGHGGEYLRVNQAFADILGRTPQELVGLTFSDVVHPDDRDVDARLRDGLVAGVLDRYEREKRVVRPDGEIRWVRMTAVPVREDSGRRYVIGHAEDVTDRHEAEEQLARRALYDTLTGLANRNLLRDHLQLALQELQRSPGALAVLYLDLDKFKEINDTLGHEAGDDVLREVGRRLAATVRAPDTASRPSGDEFVVMARIGDDVDAVRIAERLAAAIAEPMTVQGRVMEIRPSIGVAITRDPGADPEDLLRQADLAMYQAKRERLGSWALYDASLHLQALDRMATEDMLRQALRNGWLRLLYQPIVDVASGAVVSAEALLRIQHPTHGLLSPDVFIDVAEDSDLIVPIGAWVLRQACADLARWRSRPGADPGMRVSVNVSGRQARHAAVTDQVLEAAATAGLDPSALVLEITERVLVDATGPVVADLHRVVSLGAGLALDDFGTGYSSLTYLKRFPISTVKIDKSFVEGLVDAGDDRAIVEAVVGMARLLNLTAVAEGVELAEQVEHLRLLGCQRAQGYHLGQPVDATVFAARLSA